MVVYEVDSFNQCLAGFEVTSFVIESFRVHNARAIAYGQLWLKNMTLPANHIDHVVGFPWKLAARVKAGRLALSLIEPRGIHLSSAASISEEACDLVSAEIAQALELYPETLDEEPAHPGAVLQTPWQKRLVSARHRVKLPWKNASSVRRPLEVIPRYAGPRAAYTGACVCDELEDSNQRTPFDWKARTKGLYPARCFECSCGARWWCSRPGMHCWYRVVDDIAWKLLSEHNGIPPFGKIVYDEDDCIRMADAFETERQNPSCRVHTE